MPLACAIDTVGYREGRRRDSERRSFGPTSDASTPTTDGRPAGRVSFLSADDDRSASGLTTRAVNLRIYRVIGELLVSGFDANDQEMLSQRDGRTSRIRTPADKPFL